jgi:hypothetical protein
MELYASLTEKLENALPITAYPTRDLIQALRSNDKIITLKTVFTITKVVNSGDMSGILCTIEETGGVVTMCGLTFLQFDPALPLYKEIVAHQIKRFKRIEKLNKMNGR